MKILENVMVLGREREPPNSVKGRAYGAILSHGLSIKLLVSTDQSDCPEQFLTKSSPNKKSSKWRARNENSTVSLS